MKESLLPLLAVLIPLLSVIGIPFLDWKRGNRFTALATFLTFCVVAFMYPVIHSGEILTKTIDTGYKIKFEMMADSLSFLAGVISIVIWMLSSVYSVEYMDREDNQGRYNIFSLLSLAGMMGVVFTRNLFTLYLFFELLSVASYVMVVHRECEDSKNAGLIYLFMGVGGGLILLFSIIATYAITGTGDLLEISKMGLGLFKHPAMPFIFIGYIIGFGVKAGLFPMHVWMPRAYPPAPSPTASISSGAMIKAGAYGIMRTVITIVGIEVLRGRPVLMLLLIFAFINIFFGSALAIKQTELKKMLAYSSISQIGYVILGVALLTPLGIIGGIIHIFNHAIMKGTLFLCAGAFIHQTGLRHLKDLRGIGRRMPLTTFCFTMAGLSMIGFPPFNGFISKWYLAIGSLEVTKTGSFNAGVGMISLSILLLSSFMNLVYYGPVMYRAWVAGDNESGSNDDPNMWMMVPLLILGLATIFFGIFPQFPIELAQQITHVYFQ